MSLFQLYFIQFTILNSKWNAKCFNLQIENKWKRFRNE